jgi:plastocyanin
VRRALHAGALLGAIAITGGLVIVPTVAAAAGVPAQTIAIGVDHSTPPGHNFEYVDYFPRSGVRVHSGDVVNFAWANTPDGLHTATLLKANESPADAWNNTPFAVPDQGDAGQLMINPAVLAPSNPSCGTPAAPCVFNGGSDLNSGALPTNAGAAFAVEITAAPGTYDFVCEIHPGMKGSFTVVGTHAAATPAHRVKALARKQARRDTKEALAAEAAVPPAQVQTSGNHHLVTLTAGAATPYVEIAEMLPQHVRVNRDDTIQWVTQAMKDPHTVTFPQGDDPATEPIPAMCDGTPDTAFTPPASGPPCGDPTKFELHFNPAPSGGTIISSSSTSATSGVFAPFPPFPDQTQEFSFPTAGTFTYQCRIHDHMTGTITVG